MELWIRSQNKEKLVKVNELSLYDSNILKNDFVLNDKPNYSNISIIANDNYNLGSYKSKERALEVLDDIQHILNPIVDRKILEIEQKYLLNGTNFIQPKLKDIEISEFSTYVYEMPEE